MSKRKLGWLVLQHVRKRHGNNHIVLDGVETVLVNTDHLRGGCFRGRCVLLQRHRSFHVSDRKFEGSGKGSFFFHEAKEKGFHRPLESILVAGLAFNGMEAGFDHDRCRHVSKSVVTGRVGVGNDNAIFGMSGLVKNANLKAKSLGVDGVVADRDSHLVPWR